MTNRVIAAIPVSLKKALGGWIDRRRFPPGTFPLSKNAKRRIFHRAFLRRTITKGQSSVAWRQRGGGKRSKTWRTGIQYA
nr:hypothetical protein [uncultured Rhodopila sp.]